MQQENRIRAEMHIAVIALILLVVFAEILGLLVVLIRKSHAKGPFPAPDRTEVLIPEQRSTAAIQPFSI